MNDKLEDVDRLMLALENERIARIRAELAQAETRRDAIALGIRQKYGLTDRDMVNLHTGDISRHQNGAAIDDEGVHAEPE